MRASHRPMATVFAGPISAGAGFAFAPVDLWPGVRFVDNHRWQCPPPAHRSKSSSGSVLGGIINRRQEKHEKGKKKGEKGPKNFWVSF